MQSILRLCLGPHLTRRFVSTAVRARAFPLAASTVKPLSVRGGCRPITINAAATIAGNRTPTPATPPSVSPSLILGASPVPRRPRLCLPTAPGTIEFVLRRGSAPTSCANSIPSPKLKPRVPVFSSQSSLVRSRGSSSGAAAFASAAGERLHSGGSWVQGGSGGGPARRPAAAGRTAIRSVPPAAASTRVMTTEMIEAEQVAGSAPSTQQQQPELQVDVDMTPAAADPAGGSQGNLPKAYVRAPPGGDSLVVTITLGSKTCNLNRPPDEPLDKALTRLAKNLLAKPSKKQLRKKGGGGGGGGGGGPPGTASSGADTSADDGGLPPAVLYEDKEGTRPLSRSLPNGEAWLRAALLEVAGERFALEVNPPTVDKLSIDRLAMVGYPTAAAVTVSFADPALCRWHWTAQRRGSGGAWEDLGCDTQYYTPSPADEGAVLRVECTPAARRPAGSSPEGAAGAADVWFGEALAATTGPVQHGPETCSATIRCVHTPAAVAPPAFRILSYNILADQYAGSEYARNVLFNYCPRECLEPGYRRPLVLRELLGFHADVMCLQEVDERAFTDFLTLHLGLQGYQGHYTNKQGKVKEGSATFWRTARFRRLASHDIRLREAFARPLPPLHAQFEPLLAASRELERALQQVTTIAQATLLEPLGDDPAEGCICVVNTHLFFHPYAPHIRTMHTAAILEEAAAFMERCAAGDLPRPGVGAGGGDGGGLEPEEVAAALQRRGARRPTVLFVGDLNSDLNDGIPGVVELLRKGSLPADYWDWVQGAAFKWGMGEEDAEAMAEGTAQIAAAAAAAATATDAPAPAAAAPAPPSKRPAAATAASAGSLFADDGHAFDSAAASPQRPIAVTGVDISLPYTLRSADDLATPYTNYTSGYKALLDYVWYEESALRVLRAAPIPSEAELRSFIPSRSFPSDHLAVVYDMEWRRDVDGQQ